MGQKKKVLNVSNIDVIPINPHIEDNGFWMWITMISNTFTQALISPLVDRKCFKSGPFANGELVIRLHPCGSYPECFHEVSS